MQERRRMRRFVLKLPCLICVMEPGLSDADDVLRMQTRNISTDGAYFATESPLPEGTRMNIEMIVRRSIEAGDELAGSCISLMGMVVRTNEKGMAVKFDEQYQISRITKFIAQNRAKARWMEMLTHNFSHIAASSQKLKPSTSAGVLQQTMLSVVDDSTMGSRKNNFTFSCADASCLAVLPKRRNISILLRFGALPGRRLNT